MLKIKYANVANIKGAYMAIFQRYKNNGAINDHLNQILFQNQSLNFNTLLVASFEDLIEIAIKIETYISDFSQSDREDFYKLFVYEGNSQTKIANFFMNKAGVKLESCYYCNIDYINAFKDLNKDYDDIFDFLNHANDKELLNVCGLGPDALKKIKDKRQIVYIDDIDMLDLDNPLKKRLREFNLDNSHNHLTLDHFLPQTDYPFLSLSLYNFVPSCYSCNSKFKKAEKFTLDKSIGQICPTSNQYTADKYFLFNLFYKISEKDIKLVSDFNLVFEISNHSELMDKNLETLKIKGRYLYHKDKALRLIEKKVKYTESKIQSLANILDENNNEIRADLFGEELFDSDFDYAPLVKFKRDIAKHIRILGVI